MKRTVNPKILFALAALALVGGGALVYSQYGNYTAAIDEAGRLKKEVKNQQELEAELKVSQDELTAAADKLNHLEQGIPELAYVPTMLKELQAFGKQNGLEVLGVRPVPKPEDPKKKRKKTDYQEFIIEIRGRGGYRAVLNFMSALQTFPKIVAARSVSLEPKQKDPSKGEDRNVLDVTMELKAFVFPTVEPATPKDPTSLSTMNPTGQPEGAKG